MDPVTEFLVDDENLHPNHGDEVESNGSAANYNNGDDDPLVRPSSRIESASTFFSHFGLIEFTLADVCGFIDESRALQGAQVISFEGYSEPAGVVTHRFVVLHLRRDGRKDIWMRLDRRRGQGVSPSRFLFGSGTTQANDRVGTISPGGYLQTGVADIKRLDLNQLLRIITKELQQYKIWPENCWFFCSLIQQHLSGVAHGARDIQESNAWFAESGANVQHAKLGKRIRKRVFERYWGEECIPSSTRIQSIPASAKGNAPWAKTQSSRKLQSQRPHARPPRPGLSVSSLAPSTSTSALRVGDRIAPNSPLRPTPPHLDALFGGGRRRPPVQALWAPRGTGMTDNIRLMGGDMMNRMWE
ncbi:hypothetical protein DL93DRAFT_2164033 [Clavulina sp. PMI_390]|nr:hypothetical protein DL93DRAFT_2164033 [Clavulina sp. PMI_390]